MQFNDDSDLPDPGDHVVLDDQDLGSATYDSDHDGDADSVKAYDDQGNQVDPKTGAAVGDGAGPGDSGTGDSGSTGTDGEVDPSGHTAGADSGQPGAPEGTG